MKKADKLRIIKWYIKQWCGSDHKQVIAMETDDLSELENLVMSDRCGIHSSECCTCWYYDRGGYKCATCEEWGNYTFPYGYWMKFADKN